MATRKRFAGGMRDISDAFQHLSSGCDGNASNHTSKGDQYLVKKDAHNSIPDSTEKKEE